MSVMLVQNYRLLTYKNACVFLVCSVLRRRGISACLAGNGPHSFKPALDASARQGLLLPYLGTSTYLTVRSSTTPNPHPCSSQPSHCSGSLYSSELEVCP